MALFGKKKEKVEEEEKTSPEKAEKKTPKASSKTSKKPEEKAKDTESRAEKKPFHVAQKKGRRQTARARLSENLSRVLVRPRITEKATDVTAERTYVFEVAPNATKRDVAKAVRQYYKVTPVRVNMAKIPSKKRRNRNQRTFGHTPAGKKAYVSLKEGDSIEFV